MKKHLLVALLLVAFHWAVAQKFVLVKCISGDCQNGNGVAEMTGPAVDNFSGPFVYNGSFKDGKMAGEGAIYDDRLYYNGSFDDNYYRGYGTLFDSKKIGNVLVPDSARGATCFKWDNDGCNISLNIEWNNDRTFHSRSTNIKHKRFWERSPLKDDWLMEHYNAVMASPARHHVPRYELKVIAVKNIDAPKGRAVTLIEWDCLADRQYYVTASGSGTGRNAMPFAGHVNYQVLAADGSVVFEGPVDQYWTPAKDGKYNFTIKFDQGEIVGNGDLVKNGANLSCSLRSRQLQ